MIEMLDKQNITFPVNEIFFAKSKLYGKILNSLTLFQLTPKYNFIFLP